MIVTYTEVLDIQRARKPMGDVYQKGCLGIRFNWRPCCELTIGELSSQ